jgi:hypothetical protein
VRTPALRAIAVAVAAACGACTPDPAPPPGADALAARAAAYLWSRQADDGGWHSATYGLLRSGQALTPFVLCALLEAPAPPAPRPAGGVERALAFLRAGLDDEGRLGRRDPDLLEYPNYATAYALRCLAAAGGPADAPLVARMADYLSRQQYREATGFRPTDPAYGGWGFGSTKGAGDPGHMDLAHTRRVLEALRDAGRADGATSARAQCFLRLLQHHPAAGRAQPTPPDVPPGAPSAAPRDAADPYDGGFYFSPVVLAANKAPHDGRRFRSYATATCDGLLALLAAGVPSDDERVVAARAWLRRFPDAEHPAGIPADSPTPWREALRFYHVAVRAEVERALGEAPAWRDRAARVLASAQRPDGSFANESPLMKEDDPILCTTLALLALR